METMMQESRPNVIQTDLYRCVIDVEESTISVMTDLGPDIARRIAEFEASKSSVSISLIFSTTSDPKSLHRCYVFRLRGAGCLEDDGNAPVGSDPYKDVVQKSAKTGSGCPHSRKGDRRTCSLCIQAAEKAELVRLIKAGKL